MDLKPYVYNIPLELSSHSGFLSNCGVKDTCHLPSVLNVSAALRFSLSHYHNSSEYDPAMITPQSI